MKKILTYINRIVKYVLTAVWEKLRRDVDGDKGSRK